MNKKSGLAGMFCANSIKYACLRTLFKTVGKMSDGIKVGLKYGFDSGESLDYVYENRAGGLGPVGKFLDRLYLDSPGWSGIRTRGEIMRQSIRWAIEKSSDSNETIELIDIASGPGRYVLDVLIAMKSEGAASSNSSSMNAQPALKARLYDMDETGLAFGRARAAANCVDNVEYVKKNAFLPDSHLVAHTDDKFAQLVDKKGERCDIAIASGLYELFPDNDLIRASLKNLSSTVREGGYLIYTNQPWHPQLEFISNVLSNRDGEPWVMRCRSQEEIDGLVRDAGFEKISMQSDDNGIFTVSIAMRRSLAASICNESASRERGQTRSAA